MYSMSLPKAILTFYSLLVVQAWMWTNQKWAETDLVSRIQDYDSTTFLQQFRRIIKVGQDLQDHLVQQLLTYHQYFPTKPCP